MTPSTPGSPERASIVAGSSLEGSGSTQPEEPELDIPLTGSPIAESTIWEHTSLTLGGINQSQCQPAKRKRKGQDGAMDEEMVLMPTIGKMLEKMGSGAHRHEEQNDFISVCCKHIQHRMRMLPQHHLTEFEFEVDSLLIRFSQSHIQDTDLKDIKVLCYVYIPLFIHVYTFYIHCSVYLIIYAALCI